MGIYLDRIVDWKEFELFVRDLYNDDGNVTVEHNVTLKGKSEAPRQIDVLITRQTKLHTYQTIVECKYWKSRVDRHVVDIVFADMDDLNISKGVIFTTTGYEDGAIKYAKSKNIDIFKVRDLTPEEWGLPGQIIQFYLQVVAGEINSIAFNNVTMVPIVEEYPKELHVTIDTTKDFKNLPEYQLYSIKTGIKGENLIKYILYAYNRAVSEATKSTFLIDNGTDGASIITTCPVILDLSEHEFRQLRNQYGAININTISFRIEVQTCQSTIRIDRAEKFDIALAIENYVTKQVNLVYKEKNSEGLVLTDNIFDKLVKQTSEGAKQDILKNGSIIKVMCENWVRIDRTKQSEIKNIDKTIAIKIS